MEDFLGKFLGNAARAKIVRLFVFNESESFTAAQAAKRAGVSAHAAQKEIRALEALGVVRRGKGVPAPKGAWKSGKKGKAKAETAWTLDEDGKYLRPISMFVREASPVHHRSIVEALKKIGKVSTVVLSGAFMGDPSRPADLLVAADALNESRLEQVIRALEPELGREIRYAAFSTPEFRYRLTIQDRLIRDTLDYPHLVLLDKTRLL